MYYHWYQAATSTYVQKVGTNDKFVCRRVFWILEVLGVIWECKFVIHLIRTIGLSATDSSFLRFWQSLQKVMKNITISFRSNLKAIHCSSLKAIKQSMFFPFVIFLGHNLGWIYFQWNVTYIPDICNFWTYKNWTFNLTPENTQKSLKIPLKNEYVLFCNQSGNFYTRHFLHGRCLWYLRQISGMVT